MMEGRVTKTTNSWDRWPRTQNGFGYSSLRRGFSSLKDVSTSLLTIGSHARSFSNYTITMLGTTMLSTRPKSQSQWTIIGLEYNEMSNPMSNPALPALGINPRLKLQWDFCTPCLSPTIVLLR